MKSFDKMSYKVQLDVFEGPLDLLLYLVKKEELDIYDIPITRITEQYLETLSLMEIMDLEVAGDFLVMAATLMQIKSRMLLPPDPAGIETEEADPREELVRRLVEYMAFKEIAQDLKGREGKRSDVFSRLEVEPERGPGDEAFFEASLFDLMSAFQGILSGLSQDSAHEVYKDEFSVAEKIHEISSRLLREPFLKFSHLFRSAKNKVEGITIFLALLELIRLKKVRAYQSERFGEIEIFGEGLSVA